MFHLFSSEIQESYEFIKQNILQKFQLEVITKEMNNEYYTWRFSTIKQSLTETNWIFYMRAAITQLQTLDVHEERTD